MIFICRPMRERIRLWRLTDVENHFETLLLACLLIVTFVRSTSGECFGWDSHDGRTRYHVEISLFFAGTVLAALLGLAGLVSERHRRAAQKFAIYNGPVELDPNKESSFNNSPTFKQVSTSVVFWP